MVEVTLSKFRDFVRHFWKLDLSAVDYKSEEDFRLIFDKYLGVEFRFNREEPKKTDFGLEAALKREAHTASLCFARDDWGEGLNAIVEKRKPSFGIYHDE